MSISNSSQCIKTDHSSPESDRGIFHFTEAEIIASEKVNLPHGLHGLSNTNHFAFLSPSEASLKPFKVLYNLDNPAISFIVLPGEAFNGFALRSEDKAKVADTYNIDVDNLKVIYLVRILKKDDELGMTANLRAPIIIDWGRKLAWQHILESSEFQFDFPLKDFFETLHKHKDD